MIESVWPSTAEGWITLLLQLIALLSIVLGVTWRVIKRPIDTEIALLNTAFANMEKHIDDKFQNLATQLAEKFKVQGERIGQLESKVSHQEGEIDSFSGKAQALEFRVHETAKDMGRVEGTLSRLEEFLSHRDKGQSELDTQIRERLAGIESRLTAFKELGDIAKEFMQRRS